MTNSKPTIFISHIHENQDIAGRIKDLIQTALSGALAVFVSSDDRSISLGDEWLQQIDNNLQDCDLMLLICSPLSVNRSWVAFEAGVGWAKKIKVVPLCCAGLKINQLPLPYSRWQAANANREDSLHKLLKLLAGQYGLIYDEKRSRDLVRACARQIRK